MGKEERKLRRLILATKRDAKYHEKKMQYHQEHAKMLEKELEETIKENEKWNK